MAAKLAALQSTQDQYRQNVELLDKPFGNIAVDLEGAVQTKKEIQDKLEGLRNLDYNDPMARKDIYGTIRDVRDMYGPQGKAGLYQARLDQYNAARKHIQDQYKDNPTQQGFLMNRLDNQFYTTDPVTGERVEDSTKALRFNEQTGKYENTGIDSPAEWTWVDRESWATNTLKDIEHDQDYQNYGFSDVQGMQSAVKAFREGNKQHKDYDKIQNAMIMRAQGNPQLLQSTQAEGEYFGYGDQSNWLMQDEKGNTVLNPQSLLGKTISGTATGGEFERTTANTQFVKDTLADDKAKLDYEKKLKEENDFVLRGQLPVQKVDATTIKDQQTNVVNLANQIKELEGKTDAESLMKLETLNAQLSAAKANLKLQANVAYKNEAITDWKKIQEFRKTGNNKNTWTSDPLGVLMNTKEAHEKIKTQEDYEKWLSGEITLGHTSFAVTGQAAGVTGGGVYSEDEVRKEQRNKAYDNAKDLEISSTETTLYGNKDSNLANKSEALASWVKTVPTNFISTDGSTTLDQWQENNQEAFAEAEADGKKIIMNTTPTTGGGFVVSYTDETGNPITGVGVKTFQAVGENTNNQLKNIIGNDLVKLGETGTRPADYDNVRTGQIMIAESGNAGGAFKKQDLAIAAESIDNKTLETNKPATKVIPAKTITTQTPNGPVDTEVKIVIVKLKKENGDVITTYKPIASDGSNIFTGNEFGSINGSFLNIDDMNIALEKDSRGLSENQSLEQQKPVENNYR